MRKQKRPHPPQAFVDNSQTWNDQWVARRKANPKAQFNWYQVDGKTARQWALPELRDMNQGHCSFCDGYPLEGISGEPIEHFKPKTDQRFYAEAFSWENLFYCCESCQRAKRDQWDDALLRPDKDDYQFLRYFEFDYTTGQIKPSPIATLAEQRRAEITIRLYELDSSSRRRRRLDELRAFRSDVPIDQVGDRDFVQGEA